MKYTLATAMIILSAAMTVQTLQAHPHVFIAQHTTIIFDEKGLAGFRIHWIFDEMFSTMICEDFDTDQNGHLDKREISIIREKAFGYIAPYNYYIHVKIDKKPFPVKFIKDFNASLENGKLHYEFLIPCHVRAAGTLKQIMISPYDPEYYSDFYFPDARPLDIENPAGFFIQTKVERDLSTLIYYETVNPLAIQLNFRRQK